MDLLAKKTTSKAQGRGQSGSRDDADGSMIPDDCPVGSLGDKRVLELAGSKRSEKDIAAVVMGDRKEAQRLRQVASAQKRKAAAAKEAGKGGDKENPSKSARKKNMSKAADASRALPLSDRTSERQKNGTR